MPVTFDLTQNYFWKKAFAEGAIAGRQKAERDREALREAVRTLLEQRFGPLPPYAREEFRRASFEQLGSWVGRVLEAASLRDLLYGSDASQSGESDRPDCRDAAMDGRSAGRTSESSPSV